LQTSVVIDPLRGNGVDQPARMAGGGVCAAAGGRLALQVLAVRDEKEARASKLRVKRRPPKTAQREGRPRLRRRSRPRGRAALGEESAGLSVDITSEELRSLPTPNWAEVAVDLATLAIQKERIKCDGARVRIARASVAI
jgi:hypothetical protein